MLLRKSGFWLMSLVALLVLSLTVACSSSAPAPAPTAAPAAPTKAAAPAATTAPAAAPAATSAPAAAAPTAAPAKATYPDTGYFKDKTINVVMPNSPGGGNDTIIRYTAPFIKKYSGAKDVLVENVTGAGSMKGFNTIWVGKTDGTLLGSGAMTSLLLQEISGQEGKQFDASKFNYLARVKSDPRMMLVPKESKINKWDDLKALGRPVNVPVIGPDDDFMLYAVVGKMTGLTLKYISGYAGQADTFLATQRGEGDLTMTGFTTAQNMIKTGDWKPLLLIGAPQRAKEFPDIPLATEFTKTAEDKAMLDAMGAMTDIFVAYFYPPNVKPEVVAEMRGIMDKALTDPDCVNNSLAKAGNQPIVYMPGTQLQDRVNTILTQSKSLGPVLKQAQDALK
jgi:tripartite-type tricarboxylate transporter receptor subunit TctC